MDAPVDALDADGAVNAAAPPAEGPGAARQRLVPPVDGRALLKVAREGTRDRLADLYMRDPLRVLFPNTPAGEPLSAVLATTSGGLVGGDRLEIEVRVGAGAQLQLVGQAAEKIYRSAGVDTRVELKLEAGPGALLELMPQGTILYDGARLDRRVGVDAAADAQVLTGEIVAFGRRAMGERFARGLLRDRWFVRRAGRLVWADALVLEGDVAVALASPAGFAGAAACGTAILLARAPEAALELARGLLEQAPREAGPQTVRSGASLVEGVLVARFLSADAAALRRAFGRFWQGLRAGACGLPERLPTIWNV